MPVRVLIVDDQRRGVRSLLENSGAAEVCDEASNGREAIEKAKALKPEVVIMDVSMPEMNRLDATREIIRESPGTAVLFLTQHDSGEMLRLAIKSGARGKPPERMGSSGISVRSTRSDIQNTSTGRYSLGK